MFTGLIETTGRIAGIERRGAAAVIAIVSSLPEAEIALGDSIAVNGACLTMVAKGGGRISFDVSPETLACTTLGSLKTGAVVNLERALTLASRLDGHLVSGHVDCIGTVTERHEISGNISFTFRLPGEFSKYVVTKGSVAIDGISLTVNSVEDAMFSINVIPHTAEATTIGSRKPGDQVNIETDIIGRYVERLLESRGGRTGGLTLELLAKSGFV